LTEGGKAATQDTTHLMNLAPVVQTLDSAIHQINHYPADSVIDFPTTYAMDSDLSGGLRYPTFEQPGPGWMQVYPKNSR